MSLASVRTKLGTVLTAAAPTAVVHNRVRNIRTKVERDAIMVGTGGLVHCWMIALANDDPFLTTNSNWEPGRNPMQEFGRYVFSFFGYYGLKDSNESELEWADIVEAIVSAFRANKKLDDTVMESGPVQWRTGGHAEMPPGPEGILCHFAKLEIVVREALNE